MRMVAGVEMECMDLLQASHAFSGIEMAMWDVLGRKGNLPVYELLGYKPAHSTLHSSLAIRRTALWPGADLPVNVASVP